jgi:hypothetical protein
MKLVNVLAAAIFFVLVMLYNEHKINTKVVEGFWIFNWLKRIREAEGELGENKTYENWVGYLYKNVENSALCLNDFKSRVFTDSCQFRDDWAYNLPKGMNRPIGADSSALATTAYRSFMKCVGERKPRCINLLNDARRRFFQDTNCGFKNQTDFSAYTRNIPMVFP